MLFKWLATIWHFPNVWFVYFIIWSVGWLLPFDCFKLGFALWSLLILMFWVNLLLTLFEPWHFYKDIHISQIGLDNTLGCVFADGSQWRVLLVFALGSHFRPSGRGDVCVCWRVNRLLARGMNLKLLKIFFWYVMLVLVIVVVRSSNEWFCWCVYFWLGMMRHNINRNWIHLAMVSSNEHVSPCHGL